jgi:hypothetical protein
MTMFIDEDGHEREYDAPHYEQFIIDMETAGIPWRDYGGRSYYRGPAATSGEFTVQEIYSATKIPLTADSMGMDTILYPK